MLKLILFFLYRIITSFLIEEISSMRVVNSFSIFSLFICSISLSLKIPPNEVCENNSFFGVLSEIKQSISSLCCFSFAEISKFFNLIFKMFSQVFIFSVRSLGSIWRFLVLLLDIEPNPKKIIKIFYPKHC